MFAFAAAVVFLLVAFGVVEDTTDVKYLYLGLALWALEFGFYQVVARVQGVRNSSREPRES